MPINPTLPLAVQPPQVQPYNPLATLGQVAQLQHAQQQGRIGEMQLRQAEQQYADEQATKQALAGVDITQPQGRTQAIQNVLKTGNYKAGMALATGFAKQAQEERKAESDRIKAERDRLELASQVFNPIVERIKVSAAQGDPQHTAAVYAGARDFLLQRGYPSLVKEMPEQFDPAVLPHLDTLVQQGIDLKEQKQQELKRIDQALAGEKFTEEKRQFGITSTETGRHNVQTERLTARGQDIGAAATLGAAERAKEGLIQSAIIGRTEKPLEGAAAGEVAQLDTAMQLMNKAMALYKKAYVGPVAGRTGAIQEQYLGTASPEMVDFRRNIADVSDLLVRERSGAAIGERKEYDRLLQMVPNPNLPDTTFEARAKSFQEALQTFRANKLKVATTGRAQLGKEAPTPTGPGGQPYGTPPTPTPPSPATPDPLGIR